MPIDKISIPVQDALMRFDFLFSWAISLLGNKTMITNFASNALKKKEMGGKASSNFSHWSFEPLQTALQTA